mmetsp:Transcript_21630/g.30936  ORF Transcript_21630/g.30936 Transcript_21630/m.30936 type:complete len:394 (-) Transcript_21630:293-1474(-)
MLSFCLPSMEVSGHELCYISHPNYDKRLSCNILGNLKMKKNWAGWEVWRFTKVNDDGHFIITSWTHDHKVLCSNPDGGVFTTENKHGSWEMFKISPHPNKNGVRIESVEHGRYLAFSGHDLYTMDKEEDTAWHLEPATIHFFISSTCHDKRLSSSHDHPFTHHNRKPWEKWVIEPTNDQIGHFILRSLEHGKYLGSEEDGRLNVSEGKHRWVIISSPHDGVFIQSVEHERKLACNDNGHAYTSEDSGGWETWRLEPIMPGTISGKQIWSFVGIGVATVVTAVAIPFAAMGVVGAMGFGAEGIAAGSMAAGMMSAEAIAGGGAVAASGTVATLQSIGVVGLGAAGASAAAGAGALVGGLSSLGVVAAGRGLENELEGTMVELANSLPLCSWRMW